MQIINRRGRQTFAALLIAICGLVGLAAPFVLDFGSSEFKLGQIAVYAAPGDSYDVTTPLHIGHASGVTLERGIIQLVDPSGKGSQSGRTSPPPDDGSAQLLVEGGVFAVAATLHGGDSSDLQPEMPRAPLADILSRLNVGAVIVRGGTIKLQLPDGRTETFTDVTGELAVKKRVHLTARGTGRLNGKELSFETTIQTALDKKSAALVPLKLRVKSSLLDINFDGKIGTAEGLQLQGQAEFGTANLRDVARWLGSPWPAGPTLTNLRVKGDLDWQALALAFAKVTVQMDGNEGAGSLTLAFGEDRPNITGTLAFKSLDVTPYLRTDASAQAPILRWPTAGEGPLAMTLARYFDADVRLSAAKVIAHGVALGGCAATLNLSGGRLIADVAELTLESGHGGGQISADFNGSRPQFALSGKLEEVDAGRATAMLLGHEALDGQSTITADLTAVGDYPSDLVRTLNGKVAVSLQDGGTLGIDVKGLIGATQSKGLEGWSIATRGYTSLDKLEAKLRVRDGVVGSESVEATAGDNLISATGTISLPASLVDLRLLLESTSPASNKSQSLMSRETLTFRGPWSAPTIETTRSSPDDGNPG